MAIAPPARVWIVDGDQWPRAVLRAELIERGYDAVGFVALRDAVVRLVSFPRQGPQAIVVDLQGQMDDVSLLAALFRRGIAVVAITGAAEAATPGVRDLPWAALLHRPVTIGAVADALLASDLQGTSSP